MCKACITRILKQATLRSRGGKSKDSIFRTEIQHLDRQNRFWEDDRSNGASTHKLGQRNQCCRSVQKWEDNPAVRSKRGTWRDVVRHVAVIVLETSRLGRRMVDDAPRLSAVIGFFQGDPFIDEMIISWSHLVGKSRETKVQLCTGEA